MQSLKSRPVHTHSQLDRLLAAIKAAGLPDNTRENTYEFNIPCAMLSLALQSRGFEHFELPTYGMRHLLARRSKELNEMHSMGGDALSVIAYRRGDECAVIVCGKVLMQTQPRNDDEVYAVMHKPHRAMLVLGKVPEDASEQRALYAKGNKKDFAEVETFLADGRPDKTYVIGVVTELAKAFPKVCAYNEGTKALSVSARASTALEKHIEEFLKRETETISVYQQETIGELNDVFGAYNVCFSAGDILASRQNIIRYFEFAYYVVVDVGHDTFKLIVDCRKIDNSFEGKVSVACKDELSEYASTNAYMDEYFDSAVEAVRATLSIISELRGHDVLISSNKAKRANKLLKKM